jgi:hypothetical protein
MWFTWDAQRRADRVWGVRCESAADPVTLGRIMAFRRAVRRARRGGGR